MRHLIPLLLLTAAITQPPPRAPQPRNYRPQVVSVSGVVRDADSGEAIVGAGVRLRIAGPGTRIRELNFATPLGGGFSIRIMNDERLLIVVEAEGYTAGVESLDRGPLIVTPQPGRDRESVEIRLHRAGEIDGQLIDRDLEKPIEGLTVRAHWSVFDRGRRVLRPAGVAVASDAEGRFHLSGLPPGDYFLEIVQKEQERIEERAVAERKPVSGYAREYWPGGGMLEAAIPLTMQAGGRLPLGGIILRRSKMYRVHGTLASPRCGPDMRYRMNLWEHREGRRVLRSNTDLRCNSAFTVRNLTPGQWTLESQLLGAFEERTEISSAELVVQDEDVDLDVRPLPPLRIAGKLRGAAPEVAVLIQPKGRPEYTPLVVEVSGKTGEFSLLAPATEFVQISIPKLPPRYCILEILYNGGATGDGEFRVNRAAPSQLVEITLSDKPAALSGKVLRKDKPVPGAIVVAAAWPIALRAEWPATWRTAAGDDGSFILEGLAPGAWRVFAVDAGLGQKLERPGFLLGLIGRAAQYTLAESEFRAVELKPEEP